MADAIASLPPGMTVGTDTFRGTGLFRGTTSGELRTQLYQKNAGEVRHDLTAGLVRTDSPISGSLLLTRASAQHSVKDPMTGTVLRYKGQEAVPTTPVQKQELMHSRKFYITKDVDITIQTLRNTTRVSRYTNEKVGTAGTPTGMNSSLKAFQEAQAQTAALLQEQERKRQLQLEEQRKQEAAEQQ